MKLSTAFAAVVLVAAASVIASPVAVVDARSAITTADAPNGESPQLINFVDAMALRLKESQENALAAGNSTNEKRQWTTGWDCEYPGGPGDEAMRRAQELFGVHFGRNAINIPDHWCYVSRCNYNWFALCNVSGYYRKEQDYLRDRAWDATTHGRDSCALAGSDPYYGYMFGSDRWMFNLDRTEVKYC